jgi:hypothetical protein
MQTADRLLITASPFWNYFYQDIIKSFRSVLPVHKKLLNDALVKIKQNHSLALNISPLTKTGSLPSLLKNSLISLVFPTILSPTTLASFFSTSQH